MQLDTKNSLLSLDGFVDSEGNALDFIADETAGRTEALHGRTSVYFQEKTYFFRAWTIRMPNSVPTISTIATGSAISALGTKPAKRYATKLTAAAATA